MNDVLERSWPNAGAMPASDGSSEGKQRPKTDHSITPVSLHQDNPPRMLQLTVANQSCCSCLLS